MKRNGSGMRNFIDKDDVAGAIIFIVCIVFIIFIAKDCSSCKDNILDRHHTYQCNHSDHELKFDTFENKPIIICKCKD